MGCGYSKISITSKRGKLKGHPELDDNSPEDYYTGCSTPEKFGRPNGKGSTNDFVTKNGVSNQLDDDSFASRRRIANKIKPISGPMRPPLNRSDSQTDFFRMLDEKIENGKDFDCASAKDEIAQIVCEGEGEEKADFSSRGAPLVSIPSVIDLSRDLSVVRNSGNSASGEIDKIDQPSYKEADKHKHDGEIWSTHDAANNRKNSGDTKLLFHEMTNGGNIRGNSRPDSSSSASTTTSSCTTANEGQTHHVQAECHANSNFHESRQSDGTGSACTASSRLLSQHGTTQSDMTGSNKSSEPPTPLELERKPMAPSKHSMDVDLAADSIIDAAINAAIGGSGEIDASVASSGTERDSEGAPSKDKPDEVQICNTSFVSVANGELHSAGAEVDHSPVS